MQLTFVPLLLLATLLLSSVGDAVSTSDVTSIFTLDIGDYSDQGPSFEHALDGSGSGSFFVSGTTNNGNIGGLTPTATQDAFFQKYNSSGVLQWQRVFANPGSGERGYGACSDASGNYYGLATTDINGGFMVRVFKYDTYGNLQWTSVPVADAYGIQVTPYRCIAKDSYVYVLARYYTYGTSNQWRLTAVKLNQADGSVLASALSAGQVDTGSPPGLAIDANNFLYVAGSTCSGCNVPTVNAVQGFSNIGGRDGFVLVFDATTMNLLVQIPVQSGADDYIMDVTVDGSGGVYIGGGCGGSLDGQVFTPGGYNPVLIKYQLQNGAFTRIWTRELPLPTHSISALVADGVGGLFASTVPSNCVDVYCSGSQTYFLKLDTLGNLIFEVVQYGGTSTMSLTPQGVLFQSGLVYGQIDGISNQGSWDGFVRTQALNYNCSCSALDQLVSDIESLLQITPNVPPFV